MGTRPFPSPPQKGPGDEAKTSGLLHTTSSYCIVLSSLGLTAAMQIVAKVGKGLKCRKHIKISQPVLHCFRPYAMRVRAQAQLHGVSTLSPPSQDQEEEGLVS